MSTRALLFAAGALGLAAGSAHASGWGGRYGVSPGWQERAWRYRSVETIVRCDCEGPAGIGLPASFFEGDQGVGPWPDFAAGGGGGEVVEVGGEGRASASAFASARISVRSHAQVHRGGRGCK